MEDLVVFVNELQDVFNLSGCGSMGIDLPQVVVVGAQSSGKSSVLENLVGQSFLPRGPGLVTRCPLVLQMMKVKSGEYGIFGHKPDEEFKDFKRITQEIENQTKHLAGDKKGIYNTPITLKLYSPSFINLTLVDLPGLTKVPIDDQPPDIEKQITNLIMSYVTNKNSLILAITPANTDLVTSDSLKIAKAVDPEGKRTLAVLTKLDLMDKGTDVCDILQGGLINIKLGIIGVVNRSHKDLLEDKSISDSLFDEAAFFKEHYKTMAMKQGTPYLRKTVQEILINHIRESLPQVRVNITKQMAKVKKELSMFGNSKLDQSALLVHLITEYVNFFRSVVLGDLDNVDNSKLCGGARIRSLFQNDLVNDLKSIKIEGRYKESEFIIGMEIASGIKQHVLPAWLAFQRLIKTPINELLEPCLKCIDSVYVELTSIASACLVDQNVGIKAYPQLQKEVKQAVDVLLHNHLSQTKEKVESFIKIQGTYFNTFSQEFKANMMKRTKLQTDDYRSDIRVKYQHIPLPTRSSDEVPLSLQRAFFEKDSRDEILLTKDFMISYFEKIISNVQDYVSKTIMYCWEIDVAGQLLSHLIDNVFTPNKDKNLLEEAVEVIEKRNLLMKKETALKEASRKLNSLSF